MVLAGTRVVASVAGSWDVLKAPESLTAYVRAQLGRFGTVVDGPKVDTGLLSNQYTARVTYITGQAHRSIEDVRATVAGIFEAWNGKRPTVSLLEPLGEAGQGAAASPLLPGGFDPAKYSGLIWAVVALLLVVNVAPLFRGAR